MADFYDQAVIQPLIPADLLLDSDRKLLDNFNLTLEDTAAFGVAAVYIYGDEYGPDFDDEEGNWKNEDDLIQFFQDLIKRSNGRLKWFSIEKAFTANRMVPDGFGGAAIFITADNCEYLSTHEWLGGKIKEVDNG